MIVTHTSPDWDAIGAVWQLKRFGGLNDHEVVFVNTGNPDPALLASAAAVADTGRVFDPARLRFDHHHLPGQLANATCAARQIYEALGERPAHIAPIVRLIWAGDTGRAEANASREGGIHALLSAMKACRASDEALLNFGLALLDRIARECDGQIPDEATLRRWGHAALLDDARAARAAAHRTLARHTVYQSPDGLVVALSGAPQGATFAAIEAGARLVLFASDMRDQPTPTYAVGVQRGGESQEPDIGALVAGLRDGAAHVTAAEHAELCRWFCHPAGFFAGRGTAKAPDPTPLAVPLADLAALIDGAWVRP